MIKKWTNMGRVVANGFQQTICLDYKETFSHVVKPITISIVIIITLPKYWPVRQLDVNIAFLNSDV